ncbi:NAD(P)-dependent oxidoreductase [Pseudactinotalea sp.]|uniref:NAD(P)-dependent oxidoreductase n=1 Tax=Pseudactinotalea sp. TaxID=1926260 RepID=UPI003B3A99BE
MHVLVAGDHFVTPTLLANAVTERVPTGLTLSTMTLEWPKVPFGPVAEVLEASGTEEAMIAELSGATIAVSQMAPFTRRVIEASTDLELIVVCRGGPVNVNLEAAAERGVHVVSTPGRNAVAAAEHAIALMLAAMRRVPERTASMQAGEWRGDEYGFDTCGRELDGLTVGLVGYGAIGRRVARILRAFNADVLVHDPYANAADVTHGRLVELDELLADAAVLSLHARLTDETRHLIDADTLRTVRPGLVLVNTARGGLVDHDAVVAALHDGTLGAVGLDVYDPEPPAPDDPIRTAPRTVLTPHLAGATKETALRAASMSADAVARFVQDKLTAPLR